MKILILIAFIFVSALSYGQIVLDKDHVNTSITHKVLILEDADRQYTIKDILNKELEFKSIEHPIEILDFNTSRWWIKISVQKPENTSNEHYILEVARPITNKVSLFQIEDGQVVNQLHDGDDIPFKEKALDHRKNLFELELKPGEIKHYIIELESDGEVITLPIRFWEKNAFVISDYDDQFGHGFYYGLLFLVSVIFFFFYVVLKDKSFLYYVLYVIFQILLQFSLDGYTFQYLFRSGGYLTNHIVLFSAGGAVVFIILYARQFLKTYKRSPLLDKIFRIFVGIVIIITAMSLIPGPTYVISYPLINGVSLLATLFILYSIFRLKAKGYDICNFFTSAFIILITGVVIFILGNFHILGNAEFSQDALKWSSALEVIALSVSMARKYRELQQAKELAQARALESLKERNQLMDEMNNRLEEQVKERTKEIEHQKEELAEKNRDILDSIKYSQRIQQAILPPGNYVKKVLPESFILYKPRDIVSGDFYFIEEVTSSTGEPYALFAAVDCTGHGVPGAFMSLIGNNYLKQSLAIDHINTPAEAMDFLNKGVFSALRLENAGEDVKDGMDMALCAWNKKKDLLTFAGAKNPVFIIRPLAPDEEVNGNDRSVIYDLDNQLKLIQIKGDSHPVGAYLGEDLRSFTNQEFQLQKGDCVYVFSDGYPDQFGGPKSKKLGSKKFKQFLLKIVSMDMEAQKTALEEHFNDWMRGNEQLDDVLVIGVKIV